MQWVNECTQGEQPANADYVCGVCGYVEGIGADDARSQLTGFSVDFYSACEEPELECLDCGSRTVKAYLSPEGSP